MVCRAKACSHFLAFILFFFPALISQAAEIVWTNTAGGQWANAANWQPNAVPGAADTAVITNETSLTVTIGAAVTVNNLVLGAANTAMTNRLDQNAALTVLDEARIGASGWLRQSAAVNITNVFFNEGFYQWLDSPLRGIGRFVNGTNGFVQTRAAGVSTLGVRQFKNFGRFQVGGDDLGVEFSSNVAFTNYSGGEVILSSPGRGLRNGSGANNTLVVNYGLIRATASGTFDPSYLTVNLVNYGTLSVETLAWYIGAGTNYGTITATAGVRQLSAVSNDPFVFENGTSFSSPAPALYAGGAFIFNTPLAIDSPVLHVGDGSGGASTQSPSVVINADLDFRGDVGVSSGRISILNPDAKVFLAEVSINDDNVVGNMGPFLTNSGSLTVDSYRQTLSVTDNAGTLTVRSNLNFLGGAFRTDGGMIILEPGSSSTFNNTSAKGISGQQVINRGTVNAQASVTFNNGASWFNDVGSIYSANGGSLANGGTAGAFLNLGTVRRTTLVNGGGISLAFTNAGGLISAQNGDLVLSRAVQTSGRTELRGGHLDGVLDLQGGLLEGRGSVGALFSSGEVAAGNGIGWLGARDGFTNRADGIVHLQIGGTATNQYDRVVVSGAAQLAGTLSVTFTNGFYPVIGTAFTAMTYTAFSGKFDQILTPNYEFDVEYQARALILRASNALPNVVFTAPSTQLVCAPFLLNVSATDLDGSITNITLLQDGNVIGSFARSPASLRVLYDFPRFVTFTAEVRDNRGGLTTVSTNVSFVTMPLHVLSLGGFVETNGFFKICMLGQEGANYVAQAAPAVDEPPVISWAEIGPMEYTNGIFRFSDTNAGTFQKRYYRALLKQ